MLPAWSTHVVALACLACYHAAAGAFVTGVPALRHLNPPRRDVVRWHALHAVVNAVIAWYSAPAVVQLARLDARSCAPGVASAAARSPLPITIAMWLHVWHCAFFELSAADVLHHAVFIPTIGLPGMMWDWGSCGNAQLFFMCGVPGAVVYALAVERHRQPWVRHVEPRVTALVTACVRLPGALLAQYNLLLAYVSGDIRVPPWAVWVQLAMGFANAVYYAHDAVRRHRHHASRARD